MSIDRHTETIKTFKEMKVLCLHRGVCMDTARETILKLRAKVEDKTAEVRRVDKRWDAYRHAPLWKRTLILFFGWGRS